ncbi:MAG: hypothetical protein ACRDCE_14305 [Cetobacterium sp.]|uniref:hypothetical protein n=1 Tax=Cetobacterium sp. TaxID=2071632 RepID=UPI003EE62DE2
MNLSKIIEITEKLKNLRYQEEALKQELRSLVNEAKVIIPPDLSKIQEAHKDKFSIPIDWGNNPGFYQRQPMAENIHDNTVYYHP